MATFDCSTIIKRGYLIDKKASILERKRWFVLRHDYGQGYCFLEHYKDEKTALKGDPPKGFINVLQVVDIRKAQDKRQCFELLCPGIAHRLMANSQSEADEWVDSIRKMCIYQGEDSNGKALSLQRLMHQPLSGTNTPLSGSPPKLHSQSPAASRSLSVPPQPILVSQALTGNPVALYGTDIPPALPPPLSQSPQNTQGMLGHLQRLYPTPPESVVTVPYPTHAPYLQKQNSLESNHPYPSPPSSDSSSMYSGSNASFDNGNNLDDEDGNSRSKFRVHVKENDKLKVSGACDVIVSDDGITLHSIQTGQPLMSWSISSIRRYGVNNVCFTFETGRNCITGEGKFFFYCPHSRHMHARVHQIAQKKDIRRRASAPTETLSYIQRPQQQVNVNQTLPPGFMYRPTSSQQTSSADNTHPQYSHIEHTLRPNLSLEPYGTLSSKNMGLSTHHVQTTQSHNLPLSSIHPVSSASSLATERGGDYEKLHHGGSSTTTFVRSNTEPLFIQQPHPNEAHIETLEPQTPCKYTTIQHVQEEGQEEDEDDSPFSPIYSNITHMRLGGEKQEVGGDSTEPRPPPVPPRLKKTNSS
ncbi:PREDICTED: uncharacterized protein LOC109580748 isoform X1 [Amphimedon queenslandica]|uniref:PH domain-containing protein n=1 Tax=Amphimedon queenslandica TaxID=400682 RepID=A0A1X7VWG9_AMPQE|nr:PREDICTED: uncharacterized protein LOC109580748 isoform X1 [Amphimedon queenslandica]|eukprot:XP_019849803.1 PREDICTED: uncharacterized protein LOC109580748 isoform X1 [Amphimedon queenslandica]